MIKIGEDAVDLSKKGKMRGTYEFQKDKRPVLPIRHRMEHDAWF